MLYARQREMELSPTQKVSLLDRNTARGGIAMQLGSHKARIIKRFFRADEFCAYVRLTFEKTKDSLSTAAGRVK